MKTQVTFSSQVGFTLVELMVAMVLGLIIIGSTAQVFLANKQTFRLNQALARVQEDGRFAMQSISRDLRMAGYIGCSSRQQIAVNNVANNTPPNIDLSTAVFGFDNGDGWWTGGSAPKDQAGNDLTICNTTGGGNAICQVSDIVQIIRGAENAALTVNDMTAASDTVRVRQVDFGDFDPVVSVNGDSPTGEDLVLVTDCRNADLFRVSASGTTGSNQVLTPNANLQQAYQAGAIVTPIMGATYFVADDNVDDDGDGNPDPVPSLYRMGLTDGGTAPVALPIAKGVEMMAVQYGVDSDNDFFADTYVNAGAVTDWSVVVSARVSLLIKSKQDFVTDQPVPITFVDGTVVNNGAGADRRLRLVYSTTIGMRNRMP